ncbi:hypothetical protein, partial [Variovorax sp. WDL1]|uniref:hypothetical protein n=1 Tax=Variovorax sp. WDL1 TaxID=207745 RepID=UPI0018DB2172
MGQLVRIGRHAVQSGHHHQASQTGIEPGGRRWLRRCRGRRLDDRQTAVDGAFFIMMVIGAVNGFDALADLDANADGQLNAEDLAWGSLQVWRDLDQDGIA